MSLQTLLQPVNTIPELVVDVQADDRFWIDLTADVRQRPLLFDCSSGCWSNLLQIRPGGRLAKHYHTGPVNALVLEGAWRYLEHDWVATKGTFIYEPPGEIHTLCADDQLGMTTFFVTRGSLIYTDDVGMQIGFEDVFTRLALFRKHLADRGLDQKIADQMIR